MQIEILERTPSLRPEFFKQEATCWRGIRWLKKITPIASALTALKLLPCVGAQENWTWCDHIVQNKTNILQALLEKVSIEEGREAGAFTRFTVEITIAGACLLGILLFRNCSYCPAITLEQRNKVKLEKKIKDQLARLQRVFDNGDERYSYGPAKKEIVVDEAFISEEEPVEEINEVGLIIHPDPLASDDDLLDFDL